MKEAWNNKLKETVNENKTPNMPKLQEERKESIEAQMVALQKFPRKSDQK